MEHIVKITWLSVTGLTSKDRNIREFKGSVDDIPVSGEMKVIELSEPNIHGTSKITYRLSFDDKSIKNHPAYYRIRRRLIVEMCNQDPGMYRPAVDDKNVKKKEGTNVEDEGWSGDTHSLYE